MKTLNKKYSVINQKCNHCTGENLHAYHNNPNEGRCPFCGNWSEIKPQMTDEIYWELRKMMREEGAWCGAVNMHIYSTEEYIQEFGVKMSDKLKSLLRTYVGQMQSYLDDRILEPKK